ncbi:AAA family ATPase [Candidatus Uhrbacteria bacterium]|nr:AAA family ATPase [Candidatus Uhrbacteria bacterium]
MAVATPCTRCGGSGFVSGARCSRCRGAALGLQWGNRVLTWSWAVDRASVRERRLRERVHAVVTVLYGMLAVIAIAVAVQQMDGFTVWGDGLLAAASSLGGALLLGMIVVANVVRAAARGVPRPIARVDADSDIRALGDEPPPPVSQCIVLAEHLDAEVRTALERAGALAERLHHSTVLPIHCFAALAGTERGAAVLGRLGVAPDALRDRVQRMLAGIAPFAQIVRVAPETVDVIASAYVRAVRERRPTMGVLDVFLALAQDPNGPIRLLWEDLGVSPAQVENVVVWIRIRDALREQYRRYRRIGALRPRGDMNRAMTAVATPVLDAFAEDITARAVHGGMMPMVGRSGVVQECFRIIATGRRGVLFVGPPGIGKTAVIEGIADRMAGEDVPPQLRDKRCMRLSIARLTSGADPMEAQARLLATLAEVVRSQNIVLVLEQLEQWTATGVGVSLADVLVQEMERTGMICLATTTSDAYHRAIAPTALAALFERIPLEEPVGDEAIQMLEARSMVIEEQHQVFFSYGALDACVRLSQRYLHDRVLPEKAVALMEEAAALVRARHGTGAVITAEHIGELITEKTGVPTQAVTTDEAERLLHLEDRLHERIIGQDAAIRAVAAALRRARVDLREGKRPIAAFLFLGPTGVGKTALAKAVAAEYFGQEDAMIRLDMSEYQDASSVHRLIGAPPGYAGSDAGGQLTEAVRRSPYALVLLDELEKAHPDILHLFLQVFDDGRLTDSSGTTIDFTNTIIIATSNAGTAYIQDAIAAGVSPAAITKALLASELRATFRPEFLNRFDGVMVFAPLSQDDIHAIAVLLLDTVRAQLAAKGIQLRVTDAAVRELAAAGYDPQYGARPLRWVIQERVQDALVTFLLTNQLHRRDAAVLDVGGRLTIQKAPALT